MFDDAEFSRALQTYVLETAPILALTLDSGHRVVEANREARRLLGEKAVGQPLADHFLDFQDAPDLDALVQQVGRVHRLSLATAAGTPETLNVCFFPGSTGTLLLAGLDPQEQEDLRNQALELNRELSNMSRELHQTNADMRDQADELTKSHPLLLQEMAERKLSESGQRQAQALLQAALDTSPAGIVIADAPNGQLRYVNEAAWAIRGQDAHRHLSADIQQNFQRWDTTDGDGQPLALEDVPLMRAIRHGETGERELIIRRADGDHRSVLARAAPIRGEDGKVSAGVVVFMDITELRRAERELKDYRLNLEQKVEERTADLLVAKAEADAANLAKSQFLANISHEIRTPMNAILGIGYLLQQDSLTPRQSQWLVKLERSGRHMMEILNAVLDLSKIEAGKLVLQESHFSLGQVLEEVHQLALDSAEAKGLAVSLDLPDLPAMVRGDRTRVEQALLNYTMPSSSPRPARSPFVAARSRPKATGCCFVSRSKTPASASSQRPWVGSFLPSSKWTLLLPEVTKGPAWVWPSHVIWLDSWAETPEPRANRAGAVFSGSPPGWQ